MSNLGPPAMPGWRQDVPPRLVIVPDAVRIVDSVWSERDVHNIMRWTDVSAATGNWHGIAIATPTVSRSALFRPSFLEAWREWAESTRIRIVLADGVEESDDITILGPPGPASTVTFFCKEFFKQHSLLSAWSELLEHMMPQCELSLDGRFQLEGWLSNSQIALPANVDPKEIVVVRQQTQIAYSIPAVSDSSLPKAC